MVDGRKSQQYGGDAIADGTSAAPAGPQPWQQQLRRLTALLKSDAGAIIRFDRRQNAARLVCTTGFSNIFANAFVQDGPLAGDFRDAIGSLPIAPDTTANVSGQSGAFDDHLRNGLQAEGLLHWAYLVIWQGGGRAHCLISGRRDPMAPYSGGERDLLAAAGIGMRSALESLDSLETMAAEYAATLQALDLLPQGIVVVAAGGRILAANAAARSLMRLNDGIIDNSSILCAADPELTTALHAILAGHRANAGRAAQTLSLPRSGERPPLEAMIARTTMRLAAIDRNATSVVVINDPAPRLAPSIAALRRLYGLTPAEGRVAAHIGHGISVADAAQSLGISVGTTRTHLKRIFGKTGATRQAQLVRLIWDVTVQLANAAGETPPSASTGSERIDPTQRVSRPEETWHDAH